MGWRDRCLRHGPAILVVAIGAALRFAQLGQESLWVDEAASLHYVQTYSLVELIVEVPLVETHPPLYYLILDGWTQLAGTSPVALRFPSAVFGLGSVGLVYLLGLELGSRRLGLLGAALLALSRFHVGFGQQARMYSLLTCAVLAASILAVLLDEDPTPARSAGYVGAALVVAYTHVYGLLALAGHLVYWSRDSWRSTCGLDVLKRHGWVLGALGAGLAPWLSVLAWRAWSAAGGVDRLAWITRPSWFDPARAPVANLGLDAVLGSVGSIAAAIVLTGLVGAGLTARGPDASRRLAWLAGPWAGLVVLVPFAASFVLFPLYTARYTVFAGPAIFLLVGWGAIRHTPGPLLAVGVLIVAAVAPLPGYYASDQNEQWDEVAGHVSERAEPDDVVLVADHRPGSVETRTAFAYYFDRDRPAVHGIPEELPADRLEALIEGGQRVWLVLAHVEDEGAQRLERLIEEGSRSSNEPTEFVGVTVQRFDPRDGA